MAFFNPKTRPYLPISRKRDADICPFASPKKSESKQDIQKEEPSFASLVPGARVPTGSDPKLPGSHGLVDARFPRKILTFRIYRKPGPKKN